MAGLLALSAALLSGCGKPKAEPAKAEVEDVLEETDDTGDYRIVTWQGTTYKYNDHLSNFLFLGIDTREKAETETGSETEAATEAATEASTEAAE